MDKLQILKNELGLAATNAYLLIHHHEAILIDAPTGTLEWIDKILTERELSLLEIWLTHSHWDHIADLNPIIKKRPCPVYAHSTEKAYLMKPGLDELPLPPGIQIEPFKGEELKTLKEGDQLKIGPYSFSFLHTPGHSPGSSCFYCNEANILIAGDTLFRGSIGNISFKDSNPQEMSLSLKRLKKLPPETKVYSGHGPTTTLGAETWLGHADEIFGLQAFGRE